MTSVKNVASAPSTVCSTHSGTSPSSASVCCAIHAAVPVVSTASPSGIRLASRNTVFQSTDE